MGIKTKLTAEKFSAARKRLLQMHFESGVGHIGGNLSALDAMLVVFHEYLIGEDKFYCPKAIPPARCIPPCGVWGVSAIRT